MLVATAEGYEPRTIMLEGDKIYLGRNPGIPSNLSKHSRTPRLVKLSITGGITPARISREHCMLEHSTGKPGEEDMWIVHDLGSVNGLFVDGARLAQHATVPFPPGSLLRFTSHGTPSFEYRLDISDMNSNTTMIDKRNTGLVTAPASTVAVTSRTSAPDTASALRGEMLKLLACPKCNKPISNASCLPCGHVFCAGCLRGAVCSTCQTELKQPVSGFASRCYPLDQIIGLLLSDGIPDGKPKSLNMIKGIHFELKEAGEKDAEDEIKADTKKIRLQGEESKMAGKCPHCAEPAHEKGMRCPHRTVDSEVSEDSDDQEGSDLEDYA